MSEAVLIRGEIHGQDRTPVLPEVTGHVVAELCSLLFSSLRRRDQRRKAEWYLRGLLSAEGRKSVRNIAALFGGKAEEQNLHHFISSSTWDWRPIRRALAHHLDGSQGPWAWVVRQVFIPKAGRHSVGVARQFVPEFGQVVNGQRAFGVWFADPEMSAPVNWRLFLPDSWGNDRARRRKAEIPADVVAEEPEECAAAVALEAVCDWGLTRRPVLLDVRFQDVRPIVDRFRRAGVPLLTRVSGATRLEVAGPMVPGHAGGALPARRILESVRGLRRPVGWQDPAVLRSPATSLVAAVRVRFPGTHRETDEQRDLLLLGEWEKGEGTPTQLWLTDLVNASPGALVRLTKMTHRVAGDFSCEGELVGLRDYEGRSYQGWHRHMTLASVAHTAMVSGAAGRDGRA